MGVSGDVNRFFDHLNASSEKVTSNSQRVTSDIAIDFNMMFSTVWRKTY